MRIYLASSWRHAGQPMMVRMLRNQGHEVYDFRNPEPGDHGFHWSDIDPEWKMWTAEAFVNGLNHKLAVDGCAKDLSGMQSANVCVLLLPCGRSAHLEAGWFIGQGRPVYILASDDIEPELMYRLATRVCCNVDELFDALKDGA